MLVSDGDEESGRERARESETARDREQE